MRKEPYKHLDENIVAPFKQIACGGAKGIIDYIDLLSRNHVSRKVGVGIRHHRTSGVKIWILLPQFLVFPLNSKEPFIVRVFQVTTGAFALLNNFLDGLYGRGEVGNGYYARQLRIFRCLRAGETYGQPIFAELLG